MSDLIAYQKALKASRKKQFNLFDSLGQFTSDFMEDRNQPSNQIRESFD